MFGLYNQKKHLHPFERSGSHTYDEDSEQYVTGGVTLLPSLVILPLFTPLGSHSWVRVSGELDMRDMRKGMWPARWG